MYQRQPYSFPTSQSNYPNGMSSNHTNPIKSDLKNKENIPMNPQPLTKSHTLHNHQNPLKEAHGSNYHHLSSSLKPREHHDFNNRVPLDRHTSVGAKRKESFSNRGHETEEGELNISLLDMEKESANTRREVRQEKEILISEFKSLGDKLKKMQDNERKSHDQKSHGRRHSMSRMEKHDNNQGKENCGGENSEVFHHEILHKIEDLNQKYRKLARNITNYADERSSYNTRSTMKDTESARSHRFEENPRQTRGPEYRVEQIREKLNRNESKRSFLPEISTERESEFAREVKEVKEELEREREEFLRRKIEAETELKTQREEAEIKRKSLVEVENELQKREADIEERTKILEGNEKEFEALTERLEKQSEELTTQKVEYNKTLEAFNRRVEAFEREKAEFLKYEDEFNMRNIELRSDQEHLRAFQEKLAEENEAFEEKCRELKREYEEFQQRKRALEMAEEEFEEKNERYNEDVEALNVERQEFIKLVELAEKKLREQEEGLNEREDMLNLRKEKYDDFDLKLLGMRLNEEVWQKKRDIEVGALQEEIKKIKDKEKELKKREEKLKKIEGTLGEERSTSGRNTEFSRNDKSLLPISGRTSKTDNEREETEY